MCRRRLPVRDWRYAADSIFLAHTEQLYTALDKFQVSVKTSYRYAVCLPARRKNQLSALCNDWVHKTALIDLNRYDSYTNGIPV
jgi:hypothetical protein